MFEVFLKVNAQSVIAASPLTPGRFSLDKIIQNEIPRTPYIGNINEAHQAISVLSDPRCTVVDDYLQATFDAGFMTTIGVGCGMLFWRNYMLPIDKNSGKYAVKDYRNLFIDNGVLCGISVSILPANDQNKAQMVFALTRGVNRPYDEQECYLYIHTDFKKEMDRARLLKALPDSTSLSVTNIKALLKGLITNEKVLTIINTIFNDNELNEVALDNMLQADAKEANYLRTHIPKTISSMSLIKHQGRLQYIDALLHPIDDEEQFKQRHIIGFEEFKNNASKHIKISLYSDDYQWLFYRLTKDFNIPFNQLESYANRTDLLMLFAYCSDIQSIELSKNQITTLTILYDKYYNRIINQELVNDITGLISELLATNNASLNTERTLKQIHIKYFLYRHHIEPSDKLYQIINDDTLSNKLFNIINHIEAYQQQLNRHLLNIPKKRQAIEHEFNQSIKSLINKSSELMTTNQLLSAHAIAKKINRSLHAIKEKAAEERHPWLIKSTQILANALIFTLTFGLAQEAHAQITGKYWFFSNHKTTTSKILDKACVELTNVIAPSA